MQQTVRRKFEFKTLILVPLCYGIWGAGTYFAAGSAYLVAFLPILAIVTAFHTSVQHEVLHGHPTPYDGFNEFLVSFPFALILPFRRYRDLHLKHHEDVHLTDPYEDPESYFWPGADVGRMRPVVRALYVFNNTFVGRMLIGPGLMIVGFCRTELRRLWRDEPGVRLAWALHAAGVVIVLFWLVEVAQFPLWAYLMFVVYPALALISVRSFAEHQAAESVGGRTAIVEAHPFWALLFLNNNLHIVHHAHPSLPWYDLPGLYRQRREQYLTANGHYLFRGYGEIVRKFAFRTKQPLAHPLWYSESDEPAHGGVEQQPI